MAHFAKVENGIVTNVIVAEQEFVDTLDGTWIQTSYNTRYNQHRNDGYPLRGNYAGIGYSYLEDEDIFMPPKPFESWVLHTGNAAWVAPVDRPPEPEEDGKTWIWDEDTISWVETDHVLPT